MAFDINQMNSFIDSKDRAGMEQYMAGLSPEDQMEAAKFAETTIAAKSVPAQQTTIQPMAQSAGDVAAETVIDAATYTAGKGAEFVGGVAGDVVSELPGMVGDVAEGNVHKVPLKIAWILGTNAAGTATAIFADGVFKVVDEAGEALKDPAGKAITYTADQLGNLISENTDLVKENVMTGINDIVSSFEQPADTGIPFQTVNVGKRDYTVQEDGQIIDNEGQFVDPETNKGEYKNVMLHLAEQDRQNATNILSELSWEDTKNVFAQVANDQAFGVLETLFPEYYEEVNKYMEENPNAETLGNAANIMATAIGPAKVAVVAKSLMRMGKTGWRMFSKPALKGKLNRSKSYVTENPHLSTEAKSALTSKIDELDTLGGTGQGWSWKSKAKKWEDKISQIRLEDPNNPIVHMNNPFATLKVTETKGIPLVVKKIATSEGGDSLVKQAIQGIKQGAINTIGEAALVLGEETAYAGTLYLDALNNFKEQGFTDDQAETYATDLTMEVMIDRFGISAVETLAGLIDIPGVNILKDIGFNVAKVQKAVGNIDKEGNYIPLEGSTEKESATYNREADSYAQYEAAMVP